MSREENYAVPATRVEQEPVTLQICCNIHRITCRRVTWILIVPATILLCLGIIIILCSTVRMLDYNTLLQSRQHQSYHVIGGAFVAFGLGLAIISYVIYRRVGDNVIRPLPNQTMHDIYHTSISDSTSQTDQETGDGSGTYLDFSNTLSSQPRSCIREFYTACCTLPIQVAQVPHVVPNIPYRSSSMEIINDDPPSHGSSSSLTSNEKITPRQSTMAPMEAKINNSPIYNRPCNADSGISTNGNYDDSGSDAQFDLAPRGSAQWLLENYNANNSTRTNNPIIALPKTIYNSCDIVEIHDTNQTNNNAKKQSDRDNLSLDILSVSSSLSSSDKSISTAVTNQTKQTYHNKKTDESVAAASLRRTYGPDSHDEEILSSLPTVETVTNNVPFGYHTLVSRHTDQQNAPADNVDFNVTTGNDIELVQTDYSVSPTRNPMGNGVQLVSLVQNDASVNTIGTDIELVNLVQNDHSVNAIGTDGEIVNLVQNHHNVNTMGNGVKLVNTVQTDHNVMRNDCQLVNLVQNDHSVNAMGTDGEIVNLVQNDHNVNTMETDTKQVNVVQSDHDVDTIERAHVHLVNSEQNIYNGSESIPSNAGTVSAVFTDQEENISCSKVKCLSSDFARKTNQSEDPCQTQNGIHHKECTQSPVDKPALVTVFQDRLPPTPETPTLSFLNTTNCSCSSTESDSWASYREGMIKDAIQEKVSSVLYPDAIQVLAREISDKDNENNGQNILEEMNNCDQTSKGANSNRFENNVPRRVSFIGQPSNVQPSPTDNPEFKETTKHLSRLLLDKSNRAYKNKSSENLTYIIEPSESCSADRSSDVLVSDDPLNQSGRADTTVDYMSAQEDLSIYSDTDHSFYSVNSTITLDQTITLQSEDDEESTLLQSNYDNWTSKNHHFMCDESLENVSSFCEEPKTSTPRSSPSK